MSIKITMGNSLFNKQLKIQNLEKENLGLKAEVAKLEGVIQSWRAERSAKEKEWYKKDSSMKILQLDTLSLKNTIAKLSQANQNLIG